MTGSENTSRYGWNYVNKFRNNKTDSDTNLSA